MYLEIGSKLFDLLEDIRTELRSSTKPNLALMNNKFIDIGFNKSKGHPDIEITPLSGELANMVKTSVQIRIITSGWNGDINQVIQQENLKQEIISTLEDPSFKRTTHDWLLLNFDVSATEQDPSNTKIVATIFEIEYHWGGDYIA